MTPLYQRIMLKLSGEILAGDSIFCPNVMNRVCQELKIIRDMGVQINVVIGGGKIFRGNMGEAQGMDRATADYMGMLATVMNALALQTCMRDHDIDARVMTSINMNEIAETFTRRPAFEHMSNGRIVIHAGGIGVPFFSTDTAAASRACEMNCQAIFKGTKVDGIYSGDPIKNPSADFYDRLTYQDVLAKELNVMDAAAISLAKENKIPVVVFNIKNPGQLAQAICGNGSYTIVS
jgi:uridylate kinase